MTFMLNETFQKEISKHLSPKSRFLKSRDSKRYFVVKAVIALALTPDSKERSSFLPSA